MHSHSNRESEIYHQTEVSNGHLLQTFIQPHQKCGHELSASEVAGIAECVLKKHRELSAPDRAGFECSNAVITRAGEMVKKINETARQLADECTYDQRGEALLQGVQLDKLVRKFEDKMLFRNAKTEQSQTRQSSPSPDVRPQPKSNVEQIFVGQRKSCNPDPNPLPSIGKKKPESIQEKKRRATSVPLPGQSEDTPTGIPKYTNMDGFIDHTLRRRAIQMDAATQRESSEDCRNRMVQKDAETKRNTPDQVFEEETVKKFSHLNYLEL